MKKCKYFIGAALVHACMWLGVNAQVVKSDLTLGAGYASSENKIQWLKATAKTKIDGRFRPVAGVTIKFYITDTADVHRLGQAVTDRKGEALLLVPPAARDEWRRSSKVNFVIVSVPSPSYDAVSSGIEITKARISIDTLEDRKIVARLEALSDSGWKPVKGVDIRIAVRRLDGDLNVADVPTYTTDSLGVATADFKRDSLPGDGAGMLTLVASVDDNDSYGSLSVGKVVGWGAVTRNVSHFDERSLFARRGRSPIWFELIAYGIIIGVWSVLLYLILQIRRLKQLGASR